MSGTYVNLLSGGVGDDYGVMRMMRAYFGEGTLTTNGTADLQVVQHAAGANQSVDISIGDILIYHETEKNAYYGYVKTVQNESASVTAADATNPRKDILVAYTDLAAFDAALPDNQGALKFKCVAGVAAGSPADPSDGMIQTAVGASNPWFKLARLTRPNTGGGGNVITNGMITDLRLASWLNVKAQYFPDGSTFVSPIFTGLINGWIGAAEAWTYASATTITVPTDATTRYAIGDKIKLDQGGVTKYFYVLTVASTLLTLSAGNDGSGNIVSVANSTITNNYYSKAESPTGFPNTMNFALVWSDAAPDGTTPAIGNGTAICRYRMNGKHVSGYIKIICGSSTTYGNSTWVFGPPVTPKVENGIRPTGLVVFGLAANPVNTQGTAMLLGDDHPADPRKFYLTYGNDAANPSNLNQVINQSTIVWAAGSQLYIMFDYEGGN